MYLFNRIANLNCMSILDDVIGKFIDIIYQDLQHCACHL